MRIFLKTVGTLLALVVFHQSSSAQETFVIDDFSDRYNAKVFISDTKEVFSPGWIAVFDKKSQRQIIKVTSEELSFDPEDGKIVSNIKELPYGEQSLIMFEDYNFDGTKDLALMDGQNSCYRGPSFQVFLATKTGFRQSPAFTRLAQEYCGMFGVDAKTKKISTMTKSSCCWHQYSDFIVSNNKPVPVRIVEESLNINGLTWDYAERNRVGGKMVAKEYSVFNEQDLAEKVMFAFEFSNKKKMRLVAQEGTLHYVFTDKDDKVELVYSDSFAFSRDENALRFTNGKTKYTVSASGIVVTSAKGNIDMPAAIGTITGSMNELRNVKFDNVAVNQF